jgi:hypothetical protein
MDMLHDTGRGTHVNTTYNDTYVSSEKKVQRQKHIETFPAIICVRIYAIKKIR